MTVDKRSFRDNGVFAVPRVISFIVLLAIILLVGAVFFQVMAQFIVPLFLACVLLVVFQPLHAWTLKLSAAASAHFRVHYDGPDPAGRVVAAGLAGLECVRRTYDLVS